MAFADTVTLRTETFIAVVRDVARALARHGFRMIAFIPSHGGNFGPLGQAMVGLNEELGGAKAVAFTDLVGFVGTINAVSGQFDIPAEISGAHAGESETSLDLLLRPDLVLMDRAEAGYVGPFDAKVSQTIFEKGMPALTRNGILGDARPATAEHGRVYFDTLADFLAK